MVASLGMVGSEKGPDNEYRDYTFDRLVTTVRVQQATIHNLNQINSVNSVQINRLQNENAELKMQGLSGISNLALGRSPLEVKLADENRVLREDLKAARGQLMSLRSLLHDFDNTPVGVPNHELGVNGSPAPKVMNEELLKRQREEDRQRARRLHRERIQREIEDWIVKSEASAKERIERLERLAKMEQRTRKYNVNITTDPWADGQFGIADQERGIDPKASQYAYDEHGPAQPPQTPDTSTDAFFRAIMPKGC